MSLLCARWCRSGDSKSSKSERRRVAMAVVRVETELGDFRVRELYRVLFG